MPTAIELLERLSAIALAHAMTLEQAIDLHQKLTINTTPLPSAHDSASIAWVKQQVERSTLENKRAGGLL